MPTIKQIKNVAAFADTIASSGESDQPIALTNPIIIVAITPTPETRFQKKINKIITENVFPIPAHAKDTRL